MKYGQEREQRLFLYFYLSAHLTVSEDLAWLLEVHASQDRASSVDPFSTHTLRMYST